MHPELVERFDWTNTSLFHTSGITSAISASCSQTALAAMNRAKKAGAICSYDINFRSKLTSPGLAAENTRKAGDFIDYLFGSEDEILLLSNDKNVVEVAQTLARQHSCVVVIKRAENGAIAVTGTEIIEHIGRKVVPIDSVGAGDAFVAGFLSGVLDGKGLKRCLEIGHEFGAMSVMGPGDWESQPDPDELFAGAKDVSR
jgi:2-dehydro-3-deoxygluconokinase